MSKRPKPAYSQVDPLPSHRQLRRDECGAHYGRKERRAHNDQRACPDGYLCRYPAGLSTKSHFGPTCWRRGQGHVVPLAGAFFARGDRRGRHATRRLRTALVVNPTSKAASTFKAARTSKIRPQRFGSRPAVHIVAGPDKVGALGHLKPRAKGALFLAYLDCAGSGRCLQHQQATRACPQTHAPWLLLLGLSHFLVIPADVQCLRALARARRNRSSSS
ncbi:MAG: hypothetical protein JWO45_204 [Spartobacteria bacterium]|nr:hypothetical protein [Spartobacteria bacterium]